MSHPIEENAEAVNSIILWRIYDVLMAMYSEMNEEQAESLVKLHEEGIFVTPPPAYRVDPTEGEQYGEEVLDA